MSNYVVDPLWQHQPPPQVPEVVREHIQLQPDLVGPESVTGQPRPVRRLFAFLDPLLGRAELVVEPRDGATREVEVRHDEAHARGQFAGMVLDLRDDPPRVGPARLEGVQSVNVSLNNGLVTIQLTPGNHVTMPELRRLIASNGFSTKEATVVANGVLENHAGTPTIKLDATNEVFLLIPR